MSYFILQIKNSRSYRRNYSKKRRVNLLLTTENINEAREMLRGRENLYLTNSNPDNWEQFII